MRLLDRYLLREFLIFFTAILMVLILVFMVAELLRSDGGVPAAVLFKYNALQLPAILVQMLGPASMLATMATLSTLARRNELTAMQAGGVGLLHISAVVLSAIFVLCCGGLVMTDRVVPRFQKMRTLYYWREIKGRKDFSFDIRSSKIWYRSKSYIYNLKTFDPKTKEIGGFGVFVFDENFALRQRVEARRAKGDGGHWVLEDGMVTVFSTVDGFPLSSRFERKEMDLPALATDFQDLERQIETLRIRDLIHFIKRNREAGLKTDAFEVDLHSRLSLALIPLVMSLLVIPFSVRPRRQGGVGRDVSFCIGAILVYWILFSLSVSLGRSGRFNPAVAVWSPSLLFLAFAFFVLLRKKD